MLPPCRGRGRLDSGWKQLLTTARPVGRTAGLLVLPYLLGLLSGVAGHALARRTTALAAAARGAAPAVVVALSILFGADHADRRRAAGRRLRRPRARLGGAAPAARHASQRATIGRQRPWQRIGAAVAVLAVAVAGRHGHRPAAARRGRPPARRALRRAAVRRERLPEPARRVPRLHQGRRRPASASTASELLDHHRAAGGALVRIAAMDTYDGLAWGVANAAAGTSSFGGFQRVGALLPGAGGPARPAPRPSPSSRAYQLPWLPDLAGTTGFAFTGPGGRAVPTALRFNVATTTGIIPDGVPRRAALHGQRREPRPRPPRPSSRPRARTARRRRPVTIPAAVRRSPRRTRRQASTPIGKVLALAAYLRDNGRYSNGGGRRT